MRGLCADSPCTRAAEMGVRGMGVWGCTGKDKFLTRQPALADGARWRQPAAPAETTQPHTPGCGERRWLRNSSGTAKDMYRNSVVAGCSCLGASRGHLGAVLAALGPSLGRLGAVLGPVGTPWGCLGPFWARLGPVLGRLGVDLGYFGPFMGRVGPVVGWSAKNVEGLFKFLGFRPTPSL